MDRKDQLLMLIASDPERMRLLQVVRDLALPDAWIGAGFVRSRVWDSLHGRDPSPLPADIDVIWHDPRDAGAERDAALQAALRAAEGTAAWSVKNQARMHGRNGDAPYASAGDAMRYWPETATAVAVRLAANGRVEVAAPYGLDDLFGLVLRPTPPFGGAKHGIFLDRVRDKGWLQAWPRLQVVR